tara:strand:+ start:300 stop:545 length:246 start_codon:yes stop_codon:yes gene_type:complete
MVGEGELQIHHPIALVQPYILLNLVVLVVVFMDLTLVVIPIMEQEYLDRGIVEALIIILNLVGVPQLVPEVVELEEMVLIV